MIIYKCTRHIDNGEVVIDYATSRIGFDEQMKEDIRNGFSVANDIIEEIEFTGLADLCDKISIQY
jgi:hypothetical protein